MNRQGMRDCARYLLLAGLLLCMGVALAQPRAWLDRDSIGEGDSVTLNIETDQPGAAPDYAPLQADFILGERSSGRQVRMANGNASNVALYGIVLAPRRSGVLEVPALRVGTASTLPLRLNVQAAPPATRNDGAVAFVETEVDDAQPWVQQNVGVVVRLYYATQLASGELELDTPANASLQRVGNDRSFPREVDGRRYTVVERRFLLVPERSGLLRLPGARFSGRGAVGFFDDVFGRGAGRLSARAADQTLQVRALPDAAPQPWLPLKDLRLRYAGAPPQAVRAGEAVTIEVEATAVGATRAQLRELPVPAMGDAAQVFAEPVQYDERFDGASPQLTLTRRYSIVPREPGTLVVPGLGMRWWDVAAGSERTATLPEMVLQVAPGAVGGEPVAAAPANDDGSVLIPQEVGHPQARWLWPALTAGFALLWLVTLAWALLRRPVAPRAATASVRQSNEAMATHSLADLKRALEQGDLDEIELALRGMARPAVASLDELEARLDEPTQRDALDALRRARWAGGPPAAARAALRAAFGRGPVWRTVATAQSSPLPPLYPPS